SITALSDFGLTVGPAYTLITPSANGTETIEFKLSATNEAIESVYDIYFLATGEDRFYYVNPSAEYAFVRVNVTDSGVHSNGDIASKILTSEGITLGTPYLVQISWNLSETFHGNGTDLSVLIKDKETMDPLKEVTYDFMYKGNFELGGFQDKYIADFSTPDRFRTGIQNPCDMHITIFIDKVDQLSFSKTDPDEIMRYGNTPSVVIQFKTFTEEGSVGDCNAGDDIKLVLFNGYNLDGDRIRPEAAIPIVTTLNSYDLPTEATLTNYTVKQVAEQHRKLCGESAFNSEIASMSEDDPTFQRWLPQRLHFVHIQPKEPIFRQGCFHTPSGIYYEHFIIQNNTAVPLDLSSNIIEIETPQQAVEHIAYFEYGGKNGGVSILSDEKEYNEAVRVCGEANSSPVRNIRVIQFGDGTFSVELNRTNWNTGELEYQYWQSETNSTLPKLISTIGIGHCGSVI
ncbi:MAG: hypothetical protein ACRD5H_02210, partial [Nitrososphaerales archaeon]